MNKEDLDRLLKKVANLRALAAKAGTQAEAETAAAMADAIIAQYRIAEADLESHGATEEECRRAEEPLDSGSANGHLRQLWRGILACNLARHYGCYVYRLRSRANGITSMPVYGRASDVAILRSMYAWLSLEIPRLAKAEQDASARNSFCRGAVVGFLSALTESTRAETAKVSGSTALALVSRGAEAARMAKEGTKIRSNTSRTAATESYARGRAAGDSLGRSGHRLAGVGARLLGDGK